MMPVLEGHAGGFADAIAGDVTGTTLALSTTNATLVLPTGASRPRRLLLQCDTDFYMRLGGVAADTTNGFSCLADVVYDFPLGPSVTRLDAILSAGTATLTVGYVILA